MRVFFYTFLFGSLLSGLMACGGASEDRQETVETVLSDEEVAVTVIPLAEVDFQHELISNGKLAAKRRVDLRFESSELIAHIYVKNGDRVRKGMKLAEQDAFKLKNQVDQALDALEKAKLELPLFHRALKYHRAFPKSCKVPRIHCSHQYAVPEMCGHRTF